MAPAHVRRGRVMDTVPSTEIAVPAHGLPALVDRAAKALASARTAAEVLEAREAARLAYDAAKSVARLARLAKVKQAHDDIIKAIRRAQRDALEIEARAKCRLADEYDAAQERGEVQTARPGEASIRLGDAGHRLSF